MRRFYYPELLELKQQLSLPIELVRHIFALRLNLNELIVLFNGQGEQFIASIIILERKQVVVEIIEIKHSLKSTTEITLGICIIANDKMDFAIQKAVELGVSNIIPLISERSQAISNDRVNKKLEHWQSIINSSCEQCYQDYLPTIAPPTKLASIVVSQEYEYKTWLSLSNNQVATAIEDTARVLLVVGPEGGLTVDEESLMLKNGFIPMNLGDLVLRAETAVCAGLSLINYKLGKYNG